MVTDLYGTVIELDHQPSLTGLLARAAVTGPGRSGDQLPDTTLVRRDVSIDRDHLAAYAEVCGFTLTDTLPATYLSLLALPMSLRIMAGRDFPFGMLGLVHVRNRITHRRPVSADDRVDLAVHLADLRPHRSGRQFDVVVEATVSEERVWSSRSTYFRRGGGDENAPRDEGGAAAVDVAALPMTSQWKVPADIGRRYGAVSGDRNPIHLSPITARAFGFPKAIAHGMWTKARSLAALEGRLPTSFEVDVVFKLPLLLPATVEYATQRDGDAWQFAVRSRAPRGEAAGSGKPHLAGVVAPT